MNLLDAAIYAAALWGHAALWVVAVNHIQARAFPRPLLEVVSWPMRSVSVLGPFALMIWGYSHDPSLVSRRDWTTIPWGLAFYVGFCALITVVFLPRWLYWAWRHQRAQVTDHHASTCHDLRDTAQGRTPSLKARILMALPGNEVFRLEVTEKSLALNRLPAALDGLTIAHLSDLHFTGDIPLSWYEKVIEIVNELDPDLIIITGDLIEETECLDWTASTFGRLRARHGVYYVLGNHDTRMDSRLTRQALDEVGLTDLGGRWHSVVIHDHVLLLAGNELPWFKPAAKSADQPPVDHPDDESQPLRICVAHSPDQFPWAREHGFDLMLAGHTHGGQIRLPFVGPIVCPSIHGVRYASGTYYEPPTIMHVSRGVAGDTPIRWNCPPEVTRLVLRSRVRPTVVDNLDEPRNETVAAN